MKIVSPLGVVFAVLLTALVVGCSSGPGQAPDDEMPPDTPTLPPTQVFSGTFVAIPDTTNPLMGMITATITGVNQAGMDLAEPELAAVIAQLGGADQTFDYTVSIAQDGTTMIALTGGLIDALVAPGASVTASRSEPVTDPMTALIGTWTAAVPNPETMVTTTLTVVTAAPNSFTLTATHALTASS